MYVKDVLVQNQVGLHARPATFFIQKANEFKSSIWVEKEENKVYRLEFEYKGVIVPQVGRYRYVAKNHYKRIYRINEDETIDLIYENCKPTKKDKNTGRFTK